VTAVESRAAWRAGLVSVAVGLAVVALKSYAAWRTQSLALLAGAAESVVVVVAALIAAASIRYGARPADAHHPFAHGTLEYLAAGIEGALVVLAAFVVAFEAMARFGQAPRTAELGAGLAVSLFAAGGHALLARWLLRVGRREHSPRLVAGALHVRGDVTTSVAVLAGFGAAWLSGYWPLDALVAFGVAFHILVAGLRAVRHSMSGLIDEVLPHAEIEAIERRLREEGPPAVGFHDLRTRRSGAQVFVEFHLVISRYALVYEAHEICDRIEADLGALFPGARVTIHVEPEGEPRRAAAGD
jgi:cation diffusion facilitator family transporter